VRDEVYLISSYLNLLMFFKDLKVLFSFHHSKQGVSLSPSNC